jgi:2-phosphosulfolactate phosphatase
LRIVDVIPTLQTLKAQDVAGRTAVVVDVLRATSTIVTALAAGAHEVRAAATPKEARWRFSRLEASLGGRDRLVLGGERLGLRIEGFDLGNSPLEYTPERVAGKTIVFCTTNGTRTLRRAAGLGASGGASVPGASAPSSSATGGPTPDPGPAPARAVFVAAFLNATAVAGRLAAADGSVVVCCAGTRGGFSLEDILLAGFLADHLEKCGEPFIFRDLARVAAALYRSLAGENGEDLARAIVTADHARYLSGLGFGDDVALCATRDTTDIVPEYRQGRVILPGR